MMGPGFFAESVGGPFLKKNGSLYRILDNTDSGHNMGYLLLGALRLNDHS